MSVHVIGWCLVSACTCSLCCHKASKYGKNLFLYFIEYFSKLLEMKKKISFVHGESQTKQVNYVGFMAEAGMPCTDGEFDSLLW